MPGSYRNYAQKHDVNHAEIVRELRRKGITTFDTNAKDISDIVVADSEGVMMLMEIKDGDKWLSEDQWLWVWDWNGRIAVVTTPDEALTAIGNEDMDKPLVAMLPISLRVACKLTAVNLATPLFKDLRDYILARAEFEKSSKRKFDYELTADIIIPRDTLPPTLGYPAKFFWRYFCEAINRQKVIIPTLSESEVDGAFSAMLHFYECCSTMLESFQEMKGAEKYITDLFTTKELTGNF